MFECGGLCECVSAWCFVCVFQYCEAGFVCLNVVVCVCVCFSMVLCVCVSILLGQLCVLERSGLCVCFNTVRPASCV